MIYELHGKIPQNSSFVYSEDVLTSTIFGNLRYLNSNSVLNSFLLKAIDFQNNNFNFEFSKDLKFHFWRKYSSKTTVQINEPDLILEDENSVLIIECKYHSFLDETFSENKSEYTNQLLRYSTIINDYYSNKKNKNIIFLTLKDYEVKECLEKTRMKLPEKIGLYWLKWEELYSCLKEYEKCNISTGEKNLVNDILQFLSIRKLKYFSGINISKNNFSWKYKRNYKYKFASKFDSFTWRYNYEWDFESCKKL